MGTDKDAAMKAVGIEEFGGRDRLQVMELPVPQPGEGEVLVRIQAVGVNPVDWKIREGYLQQLFSHRFPLVLGWDMAGVVVGNGHAARRFQPGEAVYGYCRRPVIQSGTYCEFLAIPESYLTLRPLCLTDEQAAGLPLAGLTAYQAVYGAGRLQKGQSILILGASGGVGSMAVQLARIAGARIYAVASRSNHDYLEDLGADVAIDYRSEDLIPRLRDEEPDGLDLVFDLVGGAALDRARQCVKSGGRLVSIVDDIRGDLPAAASFTFEFVFVEPNARQLDRLSELVRSGRLAVEVSRSYGLTRAAEAHAQMESGHTRGKIVLRVD